MAQVTSGKRKTAVARVSFKKGTGKVRINSKPLEQFTQPMYALRISEPLLLTEKVSSKFDFTVTVRGGGMSSQADAIRLALGKALVEASDGKVEQTLEEYDRTLLVADVRRKEKRKPNTGGKARAKIQKSYR